MTGDWIAAVARRILREDTFVRVLEPAVADLQFEAPRQAGLRRLASYAAVSLVLIRAVFHDLLGDLTLAFGGHARRHAWTPAIICVVPLGNVNPALQALPGLPVVPVVACVFLAIRPRTSAGLHSKTRPT